MRSTTLRLAGLYTAVFAAAVLVLGGATLGATRLALADQFDRRIGAESLGLVAEYRVEGWEDLVSAIRERSQIPGAFEYGLIDRQGRPAAGNLAMYVSPEGWSVIHPRAQTGSDGFRVLTVRLGDGEARLMVGDDRERVEVLEHVVLGAFGCALIAVIVLGAGAGFALSRAMDRRLATISGAAEGIIAGDMARRIPLRGTNDDLDNLSQTINRMLDRIASLMESLRQVNNDVAHDLRTPLTRLRQRLEAGLADPSEAKSSLAGGIEDLDSILNTFAALLRIAQIEGAARRADFAPCDLAQIAATVVDAFAPAAEEGGQELILASAGPAAIVGDQALLTQMTANLVENSLRHAGPGATVQVAVGERGGRPRLAVTDNGPGVPETERQRVFRRFYRLESSRSTPGDGLGLSLVAAVAKLHDAEVALADARPGLEASVAFPARPSPGRSPEPD